MVTPQKNSSRLLILAACILVVAAALLVLQRAGRVDPPASTAVDSPAVLEVSAATVGPSRPRRERPSRSGSAPSLSASEAVAALVGDSSLSDAQAVTGLVRIAGDAGRPVDERLEALGHALHLIPDDEPAVLHQLAAIGQQPDELRRRILAAALNRPLRLQGEILVELLGPAAGEVRKEVLSELRGLTGEDLGDDPGAWRKAVAKLPGD